MKISAGVFENIHLKTWIYSLFRYLDTLTKFPKDTGDYFSLTSDFYINGNPKLILKVMD